jgi:hypothetical protein
MWQVLAVLALAWSVFIVATARTTTVGLVPGYSDHSSHAMAAAMFLHEGTAIYSEPVGSLCDRSREAQKLAVEEAMQLGVNPRDACWPRAEGAKRPLFINWWKFPRPYPPGNVALFMPQALLYLQSGASLKAVNAISIVTFVFAAHLCIGLLVLVLGNVPRRPVAWGLLVLAYLGLLSWSLAGFYDAVAVALVLACVLMMAREKGLLAASLGALAVFLHFRGLWFAPLCVFACVQAVRRGELARWKSLPRSTRTLVVAATVGLLLAGATMLALLPYLDQFPMNNPFNVRVAGRFPGRVWPAAVALVVVAAMLARSRAFSALACLLTMALMIVLAPQLWGWHSMFVVPVLALPALSRKPWATSDVAACLIWYLAALYLVFGTSVWPSWLEVVLARL